MRKMNPLIATLVILVVLAFAGSSPALSDPCDHPGEGTPPFCTGTDVTSNPTADSSSSSEAHSESSATGVNALENDLDNNNEQGQGQKQGQVGINTQGQSTDVGTETSTETSTETEQDQTAVGSVDSHDSVEVEGDTVTHEAPDIPVNSAAPVFAGSCSQGVSVQTEKFGASAATGNPVCDYMAVVGGFLGAGDRDEALRVLGKAEDHADWRSAFAKIRMIATLGLL